jgi:hypothetical protein
LPLGVWERKGWDTQMIEDNTPKGDKKRHSVAGRLMHCAVVTILLCQHLIAP